LKKIQHYQEKTRKVLCKEKCQKMLFLHQSF
jgi:hypothetical protein